MKSSPSFIETLKKRLSSLNLRLGLIALVVVAIFISGAAWAGGAPDTIPTATVSPTISPVNTGVSPTPLPAELVNNQQQTIGLTLAAAILVLVVVIAVFNALIRSPGDD
jgi:hypothetical protein